MRCLDGLESALADDPDAIGKAKGLRLEAETGKLMASGATLEAKGELAAAKSVYQKVVDKDAAHEDAQAAIARLNEAMEGTAGKLGVKCSPPATVTIAGDEKGQTPLDLELQPGDYAIEFTAEGYLPKTEKVTIAKGETVRLSTRLKKMRKSGGGGGGGDKPASTPAADPEPAPAKDDPFLPSKKKKKNGGFLPAKK